MQGSWSRLGQGEDESPISISVRNQKFKEIIASNSYPSNPSQVPRIVQARPRTERIPQLRYRQKSANSHSPYLQAY